MKLVKLFGNVIKKLNYLCFCFIKYVISFLFVKKYSGYLECNKIFLYELQQGSLNYCDRIL